MQARDLIDVCEAVYDSPQIIAGPKGRDGASLIVADAYQVLAFRGTVTEGAATFMDWANDFHADLIADDRFPGRVHQGFLSSITALWPLLLDLAEQPSAGLPLYITGHSKGGALAFLAGHLLAALNPVVITFAAPKVGDRDFADKYTVKTWRYENANDLVPRLPLSLRWYSYTPVGEQIISPASFDPPRGIHPNHSLDTGYRPWVM